jgi:hypothetical protein
MQLKRLNLVFPCPEHYCHRNSAAMMQLIFLIFSPPEFPIQDKPFKSPYSKGEGQTRIEPCRGFDQSVCVR